MGKRKQPAKNKTFVIQDRYYLGLFKALLKPVNKAKPYAFTMRAGREPDGKMAYVCTDGRRLHILRMPEVFGYFETGRDYRFTVTGKEAAFEALDETADFPDWRKVIPGGTRLVARADISKRTRIFYLMGFYRAGIYVDAGHLADLETVPGEDWLLYAGEDSGTPVVLKHKGIREAEFEAVLTRIPEGNTIAFAPVPAKA
jgi:hypothetical protein